MAEYYELKNLFDVQQCMRSAEIRNVRYRAVQFEKYFGDCNMRWLVRYEGDMPTAMLAWKDNAHDMLVGEYVCELQAFQSGSGYGKSLLEEFAQLHPAIWLLADGEGGDSLLAYYRKMPFLREIEFSDGCSVKHAFCGLQNEMSCKQLEEAFRYEEKN